MIWVERTANGLLKVERLGEGGTQTLDDRIITDFIDPCKGL